MVGIGFWCMNVGWWWNWCSGLIGSRSNLVEHWWNLVEQWKIPLNLWMMLCQPGKRKRLLWLWNYFKRDTEVFPKFNWSDFSSSWGTFLHPSIQWYLLGIWALHVHGGQLASFSRQLADSYRKILHVRAAIEGAHFGGNRLKLYTLNFWLYHKCSQNVQLFMNLNNVFVVKSSEKYIL